MVRFDLHNTLNGTLVKEGEKDIIRSRYIQNAGQNVLANFNYAEKIIFQHLLIK